MSFTMSLLRSAIDDIRAPIVCHQIEYHPCLDQSKMLSYSREKGIPPVAYAPLAPGGAADDTLLWEIGAKHGVGASQMHLRGCWISSAPQ